MKNPGWLELQVEDKKVSRVFVNLNLVRYVEVLPDKSCCVHFADAPTKPLTFTDSAAEFLLNHLAGLHTNTVMRP